MFRAGGEAPDPDFLSVMHDIFRKYDTGMNQRLSYPEFAKLVQEAGEKPVDEAEWSSLTRSFCGNEEGIPFRGVLAWIVSGGDEVFFHFAKECVRVCGVCVCLFVREGKKEGKQ